MANEWDRRTIDGAVPATTLNGGISGAATSIVITSGTDWPDGSVAPFVVVIDRGLASEEKVLVTSRSGTTLAVATRGFDGTTAQAHADGAAIEHCLDAHTLDGANALVAAMAAAGSMAYRGSGLTMTGLAIGANDTILAVSSNVPSWRTAAQIAAILGTTLAGNGLSNTGGILAVLVDASSIEIVGDTLQVKAAGITASHLAAAIAGNGLSGGAGTALAVNVDGSSVEISSDNVRVKAGGITNAMLAGGTYAAITGLGTLVEDLLFSKAAPTITQEGTGNPRLWLKSTDSGTPVFDFTRSGSGVDARIKLEATYLRFLTAPVKFDAGVADDYCGAIVPSAGQLISNATETAVTFDAADLYDVKAWHDPVTNNDRVTATVAAIVEFKATVRFPTGSAGYRQARLVRYNSGGTEQETLAEESFDAGDAGTGKHVLSIAGDCSMASGDYVKLLVYHTAGASATLDYTAGRSTRLSWKATLVL